MLTNNDTTQAAAVVNTAASSTLITSTSSSTNLVVGNGRGDAETTETYQRSHHRNEVERTTGFEVRAKQDLALDENAYNDAPKQHRRGSNESYFIPSGTTKITNDNKNIKSTNSGSIAESLDNCNLDHCHSAHSNMADSFREETVKNKERLKQLRNEDQPSLDITTTTVNTCDTDWSRHSLTEHTIIDVLQEEAIKNKRRSQLLRNAKRPSMLKKFQSTVPYKKEALESFTSTVRGLVFNTESEEETKIPTLTRQGFHQLVTSLLPQSSENMQKIDEMFDSLCQQVQEAMNITKNRYSFSAVTEVTLEGLSALYDSPAYCLHEHRENVNELLRLLDEEVEKEFAYIAAADTTDTDESQKAAQLQQKHNSNDDETKEMFDKNDNHRNQKQQYSDEEHNKRKNEFISKVISGQLITPTKEQLLIPTELEWITDPAAVTPDKFIMEMEKWTGKHPFMKHSFIRSLAEGCYDNNVVLVARLLEAYVACISKSLPSALFILSHLDDYDDCQVESQLLQHNKSSEENDRLLSYIGLITIMMDRVKFLAGEDQVSQIPSAQQSGVTLGNVYERLCNSPDSTIGTMLGAVYFGSEYVSPVFYGQLKRAVKSINGIGSHYSAVFGLFGVGENTSALRQRLLEVAITKSRRLEVIGSATQILDALEAFVCQVTSTLSSNPTISNSQQSADTLYNDEQSDKWVRSEASCLSDFTGIPEVMEYCKDHIDPTTWILDVGCGEGYPARQFTTKMGARKVVGVDISKEMIAKAERTAKEQGIAIPDRQCFLVGSANKLTQTLHDNFHRVGVLPGADLYQFGCFDMSVAIFLFNYLSTQETTHCIKDVYNLLRPGGIFVFVVPHPLMPYLSANKKAGIAITKDDDPNMNAADSTREPTLHYDTQNFDKTEDGRSHYFSRRDHTITGVIKTKDGKSLNVQSKFKTFGCYFTAIKEAGFELVEMKEAHVSKEHWESDQEFFSSVNDQPLHVVFKLRKPAVNFSSRFSPKIVWTALHRSNLEAYIKLPMPDVVKEELRRGADEVYALTTAVNKLLARARGGLEWSSCEASLGVYEWNDLSATRKFVTLAKNTLEEFGAVLIQDAEFFPDDTDRSKLCYLILSSLIGPVDDSTRGPLFDVKDYGLDLKAANTLVSVTNADSGWHTDGAAKDKSYKTIGLQCLRPTHGTGGQFMLANAGNCLSSLQVKMPFFLLYELLRPLARDIMEKGKGRGVEESVERQVGSRQSILSKRIRCNAFPVFEQAHMPEAPGKVVKPYVRFRYMREWIESGSRRADLPLSPLLTLALDCLDAELEDQTAFKRCLRRGEIVYSNNHVLAHRRYEFEEHGPAHVRRHMVRVWLRELVDHHDDSQGYK